MSSQGFASGNLPARDIVAGENLRAKDGQSRPEISIAFDDMDDPQGIPIYTNGSRITGHVRLTTTQDLPFDCIYLTLQGTARAWVDQLAVNQPRTLRAASFHIFLRLIQPVTESELPADKVFRPGSVYRIPFEFIVPEQLLPQVCSHPCANEQVREEHLRLPPSLGDGILNDHVHIDKESTKAPDMTKITYSVRCAIGRNIDDGNSNQPAIIADEMRKLRVVPRVLASPPLMIDQCDSGDYIGHVCKKVERGSLFGKTDCGQLEIEAEQPRGFRVPDPRLVRSGIFKRETSTVVHLKLKFTPQKENSAPPRLQRLWTRLKIYTFFANTPQQTFPTTSMVNGTDPDRGSLVDTVPLSSVSLSGQKWVLEGAKGDDGRDGRYYIARVTVPAVLPNRGYALVPTFHSCLISRVYALEISTNISAGMSSDIHVQLRIPIQLLSYERDGRISPEEGQLFSDRAETHPQSDSALGRSQWHEISFEDLMSSDQANVEQSEEALLPEYSSVAATNLVIGNRGTFQILM